MNSENHIYIAIDLKSFYASVECVERGLDPLTTNLVVADASRTEKTICLAVSPSLKAFGISGRARLFEVVQKVREVNSVRKSNAPNHVLSGSSVYSVQLQDSSELALDYLVAAPRMAKYMAYSTQIYNIYLKYIAPEDIHVYSIDEVFIDVTHYLKTMNLSAKELAMKMIHDVFQTVGITATAGIGTNLYLCKIAMDIVAKHLPADENGVRIAELDEMSYREILWTHKPLTDFWRVGSGYAKKLDNIGIYTMGDVARCSIGRPHEFYCEELLYKLFGVNAELLIDHAWGYEPCTIADVKAYKPTTHSISSGQVLQSPYNYEKARLIVREMTDLLVLDLVSKALVTNQLVLTIGYDIENISNAAIRSRYHGPIITDMYGRQIPKQAHGTASLDKYTSSTKLIMGEVMDLYTRIVDKNLLVRRINISANRVADERTIIIDKPYDQLDLFTNYESKQMEEKQEKEELLREKKMQHAILEIKRKYGKNAILKGSNLEEGAMTIKRNKQIGGHKE